MDENYYLSMNMYNFNIIFFYFVQKFLKKLKYFVEYILPIKIRIKIISIQR